MDPSSVITQVAPPPAPATPLPGAGQPPSRSGSIRNSSPPREEPHLAENNVEVKSKKNKASKKGVRRHFLCTSLLCCFGARRSNSNSNAKDRKKKKDLDVDLDHTDQVDEGRNGTVTSPVGSAPASSKNASGKPLLDDLKLEDKGKKCIVIDLDETLVHSSFKPISNADFIVPVEIDGTVHQVYVLKRPHVDEFLVKMGELYECVLFTASLAKYADPVTDLLDKWDVFRYRLFRESCVFHRGNYVKDLGRLGRDLHKIIIVDNSPASYMFHPENAVPVASWFDDMNDQELLELMPFMENLSKVDSVYGLLQAKFKPNNGVNGTSNVNNASESVKHN